MQLKFCLYRRQNYAIILVRNVSRRGSSLRRANSKKNRDLERETELLRQNSEKADNPKVKTPEKNDQLELMLINYGN